MSLTVSLTRLLGEPATYSAIAAAFSAAAAIFSYGINRKSLSSKLTDRLYEFDKLILGNASTFEKFLNETNRPTANYFETTPIGADHVPLKAFAYFYLNLFDEIFAAYGTRLPFANDTWKAWQHYMFERVRHPLVRELLLAECHLKINEKGQLVEYGDGPSVFTDRFIKFIVRNYEKWKGPCHQSFW
jgi:hypothetical protein